MRLFGPGARERRRRQLLTETAGMIEQARQTGSPALGGRIVFTGVVLSLGLAVIFGRLFWIQVASHDDWGQRAVNQQVFRKDLRAFRGEVRDRYGRVLRYSRRDPTLVADPSRVRDPARTAGLLAEHLTVEKDAIEALLRQATTEVTLVACLSPAAAQKFLSLDVPGVRVIESGERRNLVPGCDLLGALDHAGVGIEGIERSLETTLRGISGWAICRRDGRGHELPVPGLRCRPPRHGGQVVLTIDSRLQWEVEQALERTVVKHGARGGSAVLVDVWTGELLAMASASGEPQRGRRIPRQCAVEDVFEPGSTFKIVAFAAALDLGLVDDDAIFYAEKGRADFGGFQIRDVKAKGWLCAACVFAQSSNICTAKIGEKVGARDLSAYAHALGFGQRTGVELPGEQTGILRAVGQWSGRSTATIAIGQEVSVTALQLAMAYAAVANGGQLLKPHLVLETRRADGGLVRHSQPEIVRRAMTPETSATLRRYLMRAVSHGTGSRAHPGNMDVAGKTGTAQKAREDGPGYAPGKYVSCFAGFFPARQPQLALVVIIDEPAREYYGGQVAAPLFADIARATASIAAGVGQAWEAPRTEAPEIEPLVVPDVRLLALEAALQELHGRGLEATIEASGTRVIAQDPPPGALVGRGTPVVLHCRPGQPDCMPDVTGMTLREGLRELRWANLLVRVEGERGVIVAQEPAPGSPLPGALSCAVFLASDEAGR